MLAQILRFSGLLVFFSVPVLACGIYEMSGVVRVDKKGFRIVVAEKTRSETQFASSRHEVAKLFPYKNRPVKATVLVLKPFDGTHAQIDKIQSIELRAPNPLKGNDSTFALIQEMKCTR